jgi:phenylpropionate dioxygenase-like ring-hydroxylating dioxygenase large terminal subunit
VDGHDCVVCPYHGWAFDGSGTLRSVPAAEHAGEWPAKPLVDTYPIAEQGGFVWLFYGSSAIPQEERPPIPYVPELDDPR